MKFPFKSPAFPDRVLTDAEEKIRLGIVEIIHQPFISRLKEAESGVAKAKDDLAAAEQERKTSPLGQKFDALQHDPEALRAYDRNAFLTDMKALSEPVEAACAAVLKANDVLFDVEAEEESSADETILLMGERIGFRLGIILAMNLSLPEFNPADIGLPYSDALQTSKAIAIALAQDGAADAFVERLVHAIGIGTIPDFAEAEEQAAAAIQASNTAQGGDRCEV